MAQNLDPQTAGLDLAPAVYEVPRLGMMQMQIQEYKDQQSAKKATGIKSLTGDIDLKNVHPAHLQYLQKELNGLYDVASQAYSSKDPALMKQLQSKKNSLNVAVGHSQVAWNETQKRVIDYDLNPSKYDMTPAEFQQNMSFNLSPRSIDINNLNLSDDVVQVSTVLGSTGTGFLGLADKNSEAYKTNFVDPNTGKILSSNRNRQSRRQMSDEMFNAAMFSDEGENKERVIRDFFLSITGRAADKFDSRDQKTLSTYMSIQPDFEERAIAWGAEQHYEELERRLGEKRISDGGAGKPTKFSVYGLNMFNTTQEFIDSKSSTDLSKQLANKPFTGVVREVPLGDNKVVLSNGMIDSVIYDRTSKGNAQEPVGFLVYKAPADLLKRAMEARNELQNAQEALSKGTGTQAAVTEAQEAVKNSQDALMASSKEPVFMSKQALGGTATFFNSLTTDERRDYVSSVNSLLK